MEPTYCGEPSPPGRSTAPAASGPPHLPNSLNAKPSCRRRAGITGGFPPSSWDREGRLHRDNSGMTILRYGEWEKYPILGMHVWVPRGRVKSTSFIGDIVRVLGCRRQVGHGR